MGDLDLADVFRENLRKHIDTRGGTLRDLASELSSSGVPLTADKLSKLLTGKRGVSLDEAAALAAVVQVPLCLLLLPLDGGAVAVTAKDVVKNPWRLLEWLLAREPLDARWGRTWTNAVAPLRLYDEVRSAQEALRAADHAVRTAKARGGKNDVIDAQANQAKKLSDLHRRLVEMVRWDLPVRGLAGDPDEHGDGDVAGGSWAYEIQRLGLDMSELEGRL